MVGNSEALKLRQGSTGLGPVGLGGLEDFEDGLAFFGWQVVEGWFGCGACEDGEEAEVEAVFELWGEVGEGLGVDEVAAAVLEEAGFQVQVFEAAVFGVWFAVGLEGGGEVWIALDALRREGGFIDEEQGFEDALGFALDDFEGGAGWGVGNGFAEFFLEGLLVMHPATDAEGAFGEAVMHHDLMFKDHEGEDIAIGSGVA
jgi:hypothetical protein